MELRTVRDLTTRIHALAERKSTELAPSSMSVPLAYYRDRALWEWERDELLRSVPIVAAASAQVSSPGDYHVRSVLGVSVLVTRDRSGQAHVFPNYCSHRGARLADGSGSSERFVCPYHGWTYGCDGRLVGRPRAGAFEDLPAGDHGLLELPAAERHGLIFCVLDPGGQLDLDAHLGPLDAELGQWDAAARTVLGHRDVAIRVNWKAGLENFADFYHVPYVHKLVAGSHVGDAAAFDRFGRHHRLLSGIGSLMGLSARQAAEVEDDGHLVVAYWIYPNLVVIHSMRTIDLIQFLPGEDPAACVLRHTCLAREAGLTEHEREGYIGLFEILSAVFTGEDVEALERAGDGIANTMREQLLIGRNEPGVQNMIRTLRAASDARGRPAAPSR